MGSGRPARAPLLTRGTACCCLSLAFGGYFGWSLLRPTARGGDPIDRCDLSTYPNPGGVVELDLKRCGLTSLPAAPLARFTALLKLDLGHNELSDLPRLPPRLQTLFCLGNRFARIPRAVGELRELRMLSFKSCRLVELGDVPLPRSLTWLILTDNSLRALPDDFGTLVRMRKLMLANNQLSALPPSMAGMAELELLRLANNRLVRVPRWLLDRDALPKLAWLALAGNPALEPAPPRSSLAEVRGRRAGGRAGG